MLYRFLRKFGQTNIRISPVTLGTVKIGRNSGVKYPSKFDLPSDESVSRLFELAYDLGINAIDTAPAYGHSEEKNWKTTTK